MAILFRMKTCIQCTKTYRVGATVMSEVPKRAQARKLVGFVPANIKETSKIRVTGPVLGESNGGQRIPLTRARNGENVSMS